MNAKAAILGCFVGSCAIITWRDLGNDQWPLPAPPPFRYVGAGVAFGLLALVADTIDDRIAATIAFGLLIGLGFQTAQQQGTNTIHHFGSGGVGSEGTGSPLRRPSNAS